jgi:Carbohydrate binding domain (family 11)
MARTHRRAAALGAVVLTAACFDPSKVAMCPAGPNAPKACSSAGSRPAEDGLLDDFEDGDNQLPKIADRGGYWFSSHDPNGSVIDPTPLKIADTGAGSEKSLHVFGRTSTDPSAWGALVGGNFVEQGFYDASKYAGITFKAKVAGNSTKSVRFNVGDVNTHPDGGVCKSCWNHFGKDLELTNEWKDYKVSFAELAQIPGWGDRYPTLTTSKVIAFYWAIGPGQAFDLWVDDVRFTECI